jgi:hypothetical protein
MTLGDEIKECVSIETISDFQESNPELRTKATTLAALLVGLVSFHGVSPCAGFLIIGERASITLPNLHLQPPLKARPATLSQRQLPVRAPWRKPRARSVPATEQVEGDGPAGEPAGKNQV